MAERPYGRILSGNANKIDKSYAKWQQQAINQDIPPHDNSPYNPCRTTIARPVSVSGPGTFFGKARRTLQFEPSTREGWWFDRTDLPESMPIKVSVSNIWTLARNIVLCSGSPHNYMRMVEHIVALKVGMGLDDVMIRMDSGDPPLFERSSMDLVEAVNEAGIVARQIAARYVTVKEPVTVGGPHGSFLTILPAENGSNALHVDCAVDFKSAIGKQRIRFSVNPETFNHGAFARTNTTLGMMLYCRTIGYLFADTRNLGYNLKNILVAGRWRYLNKPRLIHNAKPLEAVWHRSTLDLLAAVALIDRGRLAGKIISYKSGHALDAEMVKELYRNDLLTSI